jgi:hypothetical protein
MRIIIVVLSFLLSIISLLFYHYSGLFFFLEERAEIYPVNQLRSQGGDENALIAIGFILFLMLGFFNLLRQKTQIKLLDIGVLSFVLFIQGLALSMIEVGTFQSSFQVENGWILMSWCLVFIGLWLTLVASIIVKLRR